MKTTFTCNDVKDNISGNIVIPEGVTKIGAAAFKECKYLKSVILPDGVTEIGDAAFKDCKSLQYINIPESVTIIGDRIFEGCESLRSITIPGGDGTNYGYGSYKGIQHIGSSIFDRCRNLESVTIHCGSGCWLTPDMFGRNNSLRSVKITHYSFKGTYSFEDKENEYVISIPKAELVDGSSSPRNSKICNLFTEMCINLGKYMNKREE
jgi:hypothetical protein